MFKELLKLGFQIVRMLSLLAVLLLIAYGLLHIILGI